MSIERLVGLYITDDDLYQKYREGMFPILKQYGGGFGYDFKISEVLKSEVETPINRLVIPSASWYTEADSSRHLGKTLIITS